MKNPFDQFAGAPNLPKRGNWIMRTIARTLMRLLGWKPAEQLPNLSKFVIVAGPHTSNWDGILAALVIFASGLDAHWMVKKEAFAPPFAVLLRWLGAVPVDRQAPGGIVRQIIQQFQERDQFVIVLTPEGTRKRVEKWKSGFHRMARSANVPIVVVGADYKRKVIEAGPVIEPSEDYDADVEKIKAYYATVTPRHPDRV